MKQWTGLGLLSRFSFILLVLSFITHWVYPIKGERLKENRKHLTELHEKKREEKI